MNCEGHKKLAELLIQENALQLFYFQHMSIPQGVVCASLCWTGTLAVRY